MTAWNVDVPTTEYYGPLPANPRGVVSGDVLALARELWDETEIAIDTETTGLVIFREQVLYWSLAWGNRRCTLHASMLPAFMHLFADRKKTWIFANAKFDMHMLANMGVHFAGKIHCTQVMHSLLFEEMSHRLKDMAKHLLGWRWSDFQDTFGRINAHQSPLELIQKAERENFPLLVEYAANDAWGTLGVYRDLRVRLQNALTHSLFREMPPYIETLWDLFSKVEALYTKVLWKNERNGILIDTSYLESIGPRAIREIQQIEADICREVGWMLNVRSNADLQRYFIDQCQYRPRKMTKGGASGIRKPSMDADFIEYCAEEYGNRAANMILEHRNLTKLHGTYIQGIHDLVDARNRVHPKFNQDVARTGRLSCTDPNCFSPDTEILTQLGWVRFDTYAPGTPVAQWSTDGHIEFVTPTGFIKKSAERLVHIENQHIRLKITEDHRCLLRHRKTDELRVFSGKDYPEDWQQLHAGYYAGGSQSFGTDWVRLLVATQADGHISNGGVDFAFKKNRKTERLLDLLQHLGIQHSYNPRDSCGRSRIRLLQSPATDWLISTLGPGKTFGPWLLELPVAELDAFCEEVYFWDGSWTRKNSYSSDNEVNARWVQTVFALRGKRAHWRIYEKASGGLNYQVDTVDRGYSLTTNVSKSIRPHAGDVYCVSVPSSYILVRTNGEICVTGQCQNIPNIEKDKWKLRSAFIASQGYELIVHDFNQLEMRLLAAAAREPDMIGIFAKGWDIHMGNASMMMGIPYDELKEAKKIDKEVKDGKMAEHFLTQRVLFCLAARAAAKNIGFGLNYGMGPGKLANDLGITKEEAIAKIALYKKTYPAVSKFYEECVAITRETGYAFTILGRRRNLPGIASSRNDERARAERQCINLEIQGTAADVVKMAQINLDMAELDRRYGCIALLNVHDELIHECPKETAEEAQKEITQWMEQPFFIDLDVPLTVASGRGANWQVAK